MDAPTPAEQMRSELDAYVGRVNQSLERAEQRFYVAIDQAIYARSDEWKRGFVLDRFLLKSMIEEAFRDYLADRRRIIGRGA